jgi:hypothetical protein
MTYRRQPLLGLVVVFGLAALPALAQTPPTVDTLKQVLEKRLQSLKPGGMTERNVLFQVVRPGTPNAGSYPFQVTAIVRDYGPGYPANRFYGETCVGRMNQWVFTLAPDAFGGWQVDGRMTVSLGPDLECKKNPAAGVSSIPLSSLSGSPAPAGAIGPSPAANAPAATAARSGQGVAQGAYECWANGEARMLLNFTVTGNGRYKDSEGASGSFTMDPATTRIVFKGGMLDGVMPAGFYAVYHEPKGTPTVSFRNAGGSEASFCEKKR